MAGELAVPDDKLTLSDDVVSSPHTDLATPQRDLAIPVSMVVHGGTGVLHGNMTSLTVNQYIGMVPQGGQGVWDSSMVRELVADAVKIGVDANTQLFQPSDPYDKPKHYALLREVGNRNEALSGFPRELTTLKEI